MHELLRNRGYAARRLCIDDHDYEVWAKSVLPAAHDVPRLLVASFLPDSRTADLLKICLRSIKQNTSSPFELWVIDNNSPAEHVEWLLHEGGVHLAFNRTSPANANGSYANALALEVGAALIDPATQFVMPLHQDVAAVEPTWLAHLVSKLDATTRAAGVRLDTGRVPEGILHVLGYVIDFQLFRELHLDFFPQLPAYDVGDRAIVGLRQAGYGIFATPNTIWSPELVHQIPVDAPLRELASDRSFDDQGRVMFLHLGRGVVKSTAAEALAFSRWIDFAREHLGIDLRDPPNPRELEDALYGDIHYSRRRYYVDSFFSQQVGSFSRQCRILDIGGKRENKRGLFRPEQFGLAVTYLNIDPSTKPDICADAAAIPLEDASVDAVLLAETLEHVFDPRAVLSEATRVLRPGGKLILSAPFMFHIHADPHDFGRYTDTFYRCVLEQLGCLVLTVEKQGGYFGVCASLAKILQHWLAGRGHRMARWRWLIGAIQRLGFVLDSRSRSDVGVLAGHTTGFGIVAKKVGHKQLLQIQHLAALPPKMRR